MPSIHKHSTGTLVEGGTSVELLHDAKVKLLTGTFDVLMIELCCEPDSALSKATPSRAIALRITKGSDLVRKETKSMLHALIRCASTMNVLIHVWVSIPCTAGCTWRRINDSKGIVTGDPELTKALIEAAKPVCIHAAKVGGIVSWE